MQAQPAPVAEEQHSGSSGDEYGFEIPVMSAQVRLLAALPALYFRVSLHNPWQCVERASFARLAIESHYELLLKNAQAATPINTHQSQTLHLTVFMRRIHTHHQAAEERRLKLLQELSERGASQAEVVPS